MVCEDGLGVWALGFDSVFLILVSSFRAAASRHLNGLLSVFLRECDNACSNLPDKDKGSVAPPPALLATVSGPACRASEWGVVYAHRSGEPEEGPGETPAAAPTPPVV